MVYIIYGLGNGGDTVTTESSSRNRCGLLLPDHPEDSFKKTKANGQGQLFCGVATRSKSRFHANQLAI